MNLLEIQRKYGLTNRQACKLSFSIPYLNMDNEKMTRLRDKLISKKIDKEQARKIIFQNIEIENHAGLENVINFIKEFF